MVDSLELETHFAGDHRVVGVAVSAVVATGGQDTVQQGSAGDHEIQLVPVTGSGVPPRHSVVRFRGEERVCGAEVMEGA